MPLSFVIKQKVLKTLCLSLSGRNKIQGHEHFIFKVASVDISAVDHFQMK